MLLLEDKLSKYEDELSRRIYCGFGISEYEDTDGSEAVYEVAQPIKEKYDCNYFHGIGKMAIVPEDSLYVVKAPFDTYYLENNYEEMVEDECKYECDVYEELEMFGFDKFFARTVRSGKVCKTGVISLQEKCVEYQNSDQYDMFPDLTEDESKLWALSGQVLPKNLFHDFIYTYGVEETMQLCYYGNYENTNIFADLHDRNYGYRVSDGSPVIFDFAGYSDNY